MKELALVLSCEHGGNRVPAPYQRLFTGRRARAALASHRGYDPGALDLARRISRRLSRPLIYSTTTRLLVETNRSIGHRAVFSEFSRVLDTAGRERVLDRYYRKHRDRVALAVDQLVRDGSQVLHVAVHSFVPALGGRTRNADIALLYDPRRPSERRVCDAWLARMRVEEPDLRYRRNYPYRGRDDGLTTWLRRRIPDTGYVGIELEVNQRLLVGPGAAPARVAVLAAATLDDLLAEARSRRQV